MPVGDLLEYVHAEPLPELHDAFLVAGGAKVPALAGKCQEILMAAILAFDAGKTVVKSELLFIEMEKLLRRIRTNRIDKGV